jgi:hypothetical protein
MMNSTRHKALIVSLAVLGCALLVALLVRQSHRHEITLATANDRPLTESQAVELSREALRRDGHEVGSLAPQRFQQDNTNYYARNTITPYSGYILWASTAASNEAFAVHMEQRGTQVLCVVSMPK